MKRLIAFILCACLALTGCAGGAPTSQLTSPQSYVYPTEYSSLADPELTDELTESVYSTLVAELDSDDYLIEEVEAAYVSQEYIDELTYNSLGNVFFGYTLDDVIGHFGDEPYVFTCNGDQTFVKRFESYDDTWEQVARNVAMGTGVIVVLATVSAIAPAVGVPQAVTAIFTFATKGAVVGAAVDTPVSAGVVAIATGLETGNVEETIESAALAASEGYKMGAIIGAATGGAAEGFGLLRASRNGLTMSEAATIQAESRYPLQVIKDMRSMSEYEIYKTANLKPCTVKTPQGKRTVLARELDLNRKDADGLTNLERMENGKAPLDANGNSYEYHHVGQKNDGALALLTREEHDKPGLHYRQESEIDRKVFGTERANINKYFAQLYQQAA